ncbi:forkhead box protein K1-like isoform X1 [Schistocerca nitens]|uniref:forkhead box protein K1-like isoform X1 n=1 Tax=Schistocerca nitens TaxID=7011 RepID=UPI0021174D3F|nr:forkhead box protein K1-like isoform X1 [Schistocerca nitens]
MVEHLGWRSKRKLIEDIHVLTVNDMPNIGAKRTALSFDCRGVAKNNDQKTRLDLIVIDGTWEAGNTVSIASDMQEIDLQYLQADKNCFWIDSDNVVTISETSQVEKEEEIIETDANSSTDSGSAAPASTADRSPQPGDTDGDLSWLLNFNVNSLFNTNGSINGQCNRPANSGRPVEARKAGPPPAVASPKTPTGPRKPPFTYTELIEQALREKGELTVSGIYSWISERFSYYKANDDRWKNSVRHNLSINPHFRKGSKAPHGVGHLWTFANKDAPSPSTLKKQQAMQQYLRSEVSQDETAAATASIEDNKENRVLPQDILLPECECATEEITLEQSAGEILSGVKKEVEVQYLVQPHKEEFLNPVSKDVVVQESGLLDRDSDISFVVADLPPGLSLELNMTDAEIVTTDGNLFAEELGFQYSDVTTSQLLV